VGWAVVARPAAHHHYARKRVRARAAHNISSRCCTLGAGGACRAPLYQRSSEALIFWACAITSTSQTVDLRRGVTLVHAAILLPLLLLRRKDALYLAAALQDITTQTSSRTRRMKKNSRMMMSGVKQEKTWRWAARKHMSLNVLGSRQRLEHGVNVAAVWRSDIAHGADAITRHGA